MSEKDTGSFRFGSLDDTQESPLAEDPVLTDLQVRKIGRRFWWLLVIMILFVGGLFAAGYVDLTNRFSVQKTTGIREIENIAAVFQDRLDDYQKRLEVLESSLNEQMAALDQKTVVWQKDLASLRKTVEALDLSGAVAKEQKALLQEIRKEIDPLNQQIQGVKADLAALDKTMAARIAPLSESLSQNTRAISDLQNRIGPVSGQIVDKDQMDLELLKLKKAYQQNLSAELSGLQKQIGLLTERLQRLESRPMPRADSPAASGQPTATGGSGIREQPLP
jgi:predicted PurR-regulated permease PerM